MSLCKSSTDRNKIKEEGACGTDLLGVTGDDDDVVDTILAYSVNHSSSVCLVSVPSIDVIHQLEMRDCLVISGGRLWERGSVQTICWPTIFH